MTRLDTNVEGSVREAASEEIRQFTKNKYYCKAINYVRACRIRAKDCARDVKINVQI